MRKYVLISAITALFVSASFALAAYFLGFGERKFRIEHASDLPVKGAMYTRDANGDLVPLDFTATAENVIHAVVHIKSTSGAMVDRMYREGAPPPDMFGDDFLDRFFPPEFRYRYPPEGGQSPGVGTGSGVIIGQEGYIVTNNHVVANAEDIEVTLNDNRTFKAKLIGTDPTTDLAVIQVEASDLKVLPFMNSDEVKVGEWVMAVGNPFNLNSTITAGIVSAKARNINILRDSFAVESFIQTDAAINPGNSGGALVDLNGRLMGINTAIASPTGSYSGYGFAIPANIVKKVVEDIIEFGEVQRGFIGAMIRNLDNDLARELGIGITRGVYVDGVVEDGAADKAGIQKGDVIVAIAGNQVNTSSELLEMIARHRPGDRLRITVNRKGTTKEFDVVLKNRQGNTARLRQENKPLSDLLGAELTTIPSAEAQDLGIEGGVKVSRIRGGKLREANVRDGFIITGVDSNPVKSVVDLDRLLKGQKKGVLLEGIYEGSRRLHFYGLGL